MRSANEEIPAGGKEEEEEKKPELCNSVGHNG